MKFFLIYAIPQQSYIQKLKDLDLIPASSVGHHVTLGRLHDTGLCSQSHINSLVRTKLQETPYQLTLKPRKIEQFSEDIVISFITRISRYTFWFRLRIKLIRFICYESFFL